MNRKFLLLRCAMAGLLVICAASALQANSGLFVDTEATFFTYHRSPGMRIGDLSADGVDFDLKAAPRVTIGYTGENGGGLRVRYWDFDEAANSDNNDGFISVDALTFDTELFHLIRLSQLTDIELSGGIRYTEFEETIFANPEIGINDINATGVIIGASVRRKLGFGILTSSARLGLMGDDKLVTDSSDGTLLAKDTILSVIELAFGYEVRRNIRGRQVTGNVGFEYQLWSNFTEGYDTNTDAVTDFRGGSGDVGFLGLILGAGIEF